MPLYIEKINGDVNRPTDRQGEYRAICLFRKLKNRKKAEICNIFLQIEDPCCKTSFHTCFFTCHFQTETPRLDTLIYWGTFDGYLFTDSSFYCQLFDRIMTYVPQSFSVMPYSSLWWDPRIPRRGPRPAEIFILTLPNTHVDVELPLSDAWSWKYPEIWNI